MASTTGAASGAATDVAPAAETIAPAAAMMAGPAPRWAVRVGLLDTERAFRIGARIRGVEEEAGPVLRCNLGQPDFALPDHIREAVERALRDGRTGYCDPQGLPELREAIAVDVGARRGLEIDPGRVVVFPGARAPIGFSQQAYCDPGDAVIYPTPGYPLFESFTGFVGARPVPLHLDEGAGFALTAERLAPLVGPRTRLVVLNFPSNPTGGVATQAQLEALAEVILTRAPDGVRVYSDESYEAIVFDGEAHRSIASVPGMAERTIITSGVSKTYAWTGGRVGWAVLPTVEEAAVFTNLNINYFASISPYNQLGAKEALESPLSGPAVERMVSAFQERRDVVVAGLRAIEGVECQMPRGAFYAFPNVAGVLDRLGAIDAWESLPPGVREETSPATLFQLFLLHRYRVATMDRRSFGVLESEGEHYLRISIATGMDDLREAVRRMGVAAMDVDGFRAFLREGRPLSF